MKDDRSALAKVTGLLGGIAGRVIIAALLLLVTFEGLSFCFDFGHDIFYQQPVEAAPGTDHVVTLEDGVTMDSVADQLEEEGLIRNKTAFVIQGELYKINLYPGDYTLNTSMTTGEILTALNTDPEEYAAKVKASEAAAAEAAEDGDVIDAGSDLVDEEQAAAAAGAGIEVSTEAVSAEAAENAGTPESSAEADSNEP
ncbi:MAG: endolytic transglycosylase MltG [Eubacteriales bacterium]|nr:endolytic transglycosylase MltG [Eubacteriales bacterium]